MYSTKMLRDLSWAWAWVQKSQLSKHVRRMRPGRPLLEELAHELVQLVLPEVALDGGLPLAVAASAAPRLRGGRAASNAPMLHESGA